MIAIVPAQVPANPFAVLWPALLLAVGAATAAAIGVFRRGSIAGPDRLDTGDALDSLTLIMGIGMSAYFFTALLAMRILEGPKAPANTSELSSTDIVGDLLARAAAVTVILALIVAIHRPRRLGLSLRKFFPGVGKGLLGVLIVMPLMFIVLLIVTRLMGPQSQDIHPYLQQLGQADGGKQRALILFSILVAAPFSEEIFFRGCLQTFFSGLFSRRSRWLAVVLTSLFFAMAHGDWWARPPIFVLSLCLGYAYERTGNLWTSITIHAAFNAVQAAIFFEFVGSS